ncbi:ectoine hydroxylase [Candidatus Manganitrophus noduliformans]|uniref:Ectoine hydroxylase n=1 Tax=Candidatus Manganitrophus noduliformans TaxID=2606439 RepID=A0A7X6DLS2_9BACT|nr:ectoine hydroxylase [Candidatus Manganitrophus noduliformans]NKE69258.1 ectoine hydroxylase [Candidatus Manganitrophus noduliformans]
MRSESATKPQETREDRYPSRVYETPRMTERTDPVVHGTAAGPLTPEEVAFFEKNGYLSFQGVFSSEEAATYLEELRRLSLSPEVKGAAETVLEPDSEAVRSIFNVHRSNPLLRRLACDRRIVEIMIQLLGGAVYMHQSRINYKPGFRGKEFDWHSDFETWHVEDGMPGMRAISCSVNLTENNPYNGPLMLIPGSHRHYVSCVGETPDDHYKQSLRKQDYGVPDRESLRRLVDLGGIVAPTGPPGSLVLFECNMMHGSNSNITPWPRSNVFFVYNSVENALGAPYGGTTPRPDFIASRDFTPVPSGQAAGSTAS